MSNTIRLGPDDGIIDDGELLIGNQIFVGSFIYTRKKSLVIFLFIITLTTIASK